MMSLFAFFRFQIEKNHREYLPYLLDISPWQQLGITVASVLFLSALMAGLMSLYDVLVLNRILFKRSLRFVMIVGLLGHVIFIVIVLAIFRDWLHYVAEQFSLGELLQYERDQMFAIAAMFGAISFVARLFIEIDRKLGPGNLGRLITAQYYSPKEVNRIFMFVDMKGSTTIAEKLGHIKYSCFLQDCYEDFAVVDHYCAEIYQYVGDEAVISWSVEKGREQSNFLEAFYAFKQALDDRRQYYEKEYGVIPVFKAGANCGPVTVTEVGAIKRELSYHGDTLNTASRIQEKCNELGAELLISEQLKELAKHNDAYRFEDVGTMKLKGKNSEVQLYRVTRND
jgi:adenylate cyclase